MAAVSIRLSAHIVYSKRGKRGGRKWEKKTYKVKAIIQEISTHLLPIVFVFVGIVTDTFYNWSIIDQPITTENFSTKFLEAVPEKAVPENTVPSHLISLYNQANSILTSKYSDLKLRIKVLKHHPEPHYPEFQSIQLSMSLCP